MVASVQVIGHLRNLFQDSQMTYQAICRV